MSKEPGQFLWEVVGEIVRLHDLWEKAPAWTKEKYAAFESAIRADERAKVIEECALAIDRDIHTYDSEMRSYAEGFASDIRAVLSKHKVPT